MAKRPRSLHLDEPLRHPDHPKPVTRRDFIRQGFMFGGAMVAGSSVYSLFANPRAAQAALSADIQTLANSAGCPVGTLAGSKIPFICFDLAGGANIAGSNVLMGQQGGQMDLLSTAGYNKLGLPGDQIPGLVDPTAAGNGDFTDSSLGLLSHSDSGFLRGIQEKAPTALAGNINGTIIAARSDNDTQNNPHNPMYGIARAATNGFDPNAPAFGGVTTLIGSRSSESGGNSMAPANMINPEIRPTKVDRPSDVTGMVDVGNLTAILSDPADVTAVMESMVRISDEKLKLGTINTGVSNDAIIKDLIRCGYINAADIADRFAGVSVDPSTDTDIVGAAGIFSQAEFDGDSEFRKTASVMKMVIDGHAGAGTITMGGYDYHTGDRSTGENRDLRAGRCMGACLQYAAIRSVPLMMYIFSDGSVFSNGQVDNSVDGRGKGVWTGDNSSTAASAFLVFSPTLAITPFGGKTLVQAQQLGYYTADGSVVTTSSPAANNPNLLAELAIVNYMALNDDRALFDTLFPNHGLGNTDNLIAYDKIV